jgi:hypothetical protein
MMYPTGADQSSARKAPQSVAWDTQAGVITEMPVSALPYGHDAFGYGVSVNQDCCVASTWDAAQWQVRNLATPTRTRDLLPRVLSPKEIYLEDHTTWNNARADALTPVISGLFRYGTSGAAWRAFDDEIVAIQTDAPGQDPTIWRFAHHRSDIASDNNAASPSFWYEPRPNVSGDGRWVLFTSNWEKTLGTDPVGESGTGYRQDVFLVQLKGTGAGAGRSSGPAKPTGLRIMSKNVGGSPLADLRQDDRADDRMGDRVGGAARLGQAGERGIEPGRRLVEQTQHFVAADVRRRLHAFPRLELVRYGGGDIRPAADGGALN